MLIAKSLNSSLVLISKNFMSVKKDYVKPSPEELQKQLDEKMKKFLEKGGKIEKLKPMKPTKDQLKSWKI
mgnify:CR=1 FL=1